MVLCWSGNPWCTPQYRLQLYSDQLQATKLRTNTGHGEVLEALKAAGATPSRSGWQEYDGH
jgi:hypothetical protein